MSSSSCFDLHQVAASGFIAVLTRDAAAAVDDCFMQSYAVIAALGRVFCIMLYTGLYAPRAMAIQLLLLIFSIYRVYSRDGTATVLRLKYFQALNRVTELATEVSSSYPLLRDAKLKPKVAQDLHAVFTGANYLRNAITAHTVHLWMHALTTSPSSSV